MSCPLLSCAVHPVVQVPTQLLGVPLGTDVTLKCHVEALPKSITYWKRQPGTVLHQIQDRHTERLRGLDRETKGGMKLNWTIEASD